jgi:hypothetical protein
LKNIDVEKIVKYSIYILYLIIPLAVIFLWNAHFDYSTTVDSGKFGTFGDFVGGVFGAIWSLCGVLIFYAALKEQREDIKINRDALEKQIEALNLQIDEFRLQRDEMSQSRQVFLEQSKTLKQQRVASTYFSLLEVYQKIVDGLNNHCPNSNYFRTFRTEFFEKYTPQSDYESSRRLADAIYTELFHEKKEDLSQYFKIVYRILKVIDKSDLEETNKFEFITIFRSQLGENEMFALYYNSQSTHGESLYSYILRFNLLKHLPALSKVEFKTFYQRSKSTSKLLSTNKDLTKLIENCLTVLSQDIRKDNFEMARTSAFLSFDESVLVAAYSSELNEICVEISGPTLDTLTKSLADSLDTFQQYISWLLYDLFICSRYVKRMDFGSFIKITSSPKKIKFEVFSESKLGLNLDVEGEY